MSFEELYDSCFRQISLLKVPQVKENAEETKTTLDSVVCNSQYVAFLLTAGSRGGDLSRRLDAMAKKRNEREKEKPQNSPARLRRLFSMKKKKKKVESGESVAVSVILVDTDYSPANSSSVAQPGWYMANQLPPTTKGRLLRALGFEFPPSIIVLDCISRTVVTTEGRRLLADDPQGSSFPWWPPVAADLLKGTLMRKVDGKLEKTEFSELKAQVRGFLFGAYWCPPSRQWTKHLVPVYESLKKRGTSLEIIFCSSDRTSETFDQYFDQMPWMSFPYDPAKTLALTRLFNVNGIPALILVDEAGRIVSRHGRSTLMSDPEGKFFPWGPRPIYELDEYTVSRLRDEPSLILFTEGSPEDVQFSLSVLGKISQKLFIERQAVEEKRNEERERRLEERENAENGNAPLSKSSSSDECSSMNSVDVCVPPQADPLQIFYTGEDPICDHILEKILGLEDVELPLICIVDGLAGQMTICDQPDVSEQVLDDFVAAYRSGQLTYIALPTADGRTVAGIPAAVIEQAVLANSPSQNSIGAEEPKLAV